MMTDAHTFTYEEAEFQLDLEADSMFKVCPYIHI